MKRFIFITLGHEVSRRITEKSRLDGGDFMVRANRLTFLIKSGYKPANHKPRAADKTHSRLAAATAKRPNQWLAGAVSTAVPRRGMQANSPGDFVGQQKSDGRNISPSLFLVNHPGLPGIQNQVSLTVMAALGQTDTQLSQPRHSSMLTGSAFPSFSSNTLTGQVSTHSPLPSHFALSTVTVYMFSPSPPGFIFYLNDFFPL
jgi:hypothetical protein